MAEPLEKLITGLSVLFRFFLAICVGCIKAFIPMGVLPRKSVAGDICLITGAGSGLGRLMAIEFAKLGCILVLWDVNEKGNEETKKMVEKTGAQVYAYTIDLSKREEINATATRVKEEVGHVDILINNAGIVTGKKIFDCPDELMEKTMAVNTNACFFTTKNFLRAMLDKNHGHIVTIASIAGKTGVAGLVDYCASKFGAVGFHESLTAELRLLKADGVKTTVVCPYYINTGMFDGVQSKIPFLEPAFVIENILEAVLTDMDEILIPKALYRMTFLKNLIPSAARNVLTDHTKIHEGMNTFRGRQ